ncbi:chalcone isomerase family protein [Catenovulum sp. SM1970]|uniref:chalcone isomerase family protein n=1 Tax=Marinifaba aquimaris TaxID=2741323 RepID=UPI0015743A05|nr:chalcone isomerase family protein [Marinifaba aquimaris]NTS77756.1 chalcone isomerase family protein [Marinifaba aquimaris]
MRRCASLLILLFATHTTVLASSQTQFRSVGQAELSLMFWSIYTSELFTHNGQYQRGQRPLKFTINYNIDVKAADLIEKTHEEWDKQSLKHPNKEQWTSSLTNIWPNLKEGDQLSLLITENNTSIFYLNSQEIGQIEDPDFGQFFIDIWLSEKTSRPELRRSLIGKK